MQRRTDREASSLVPWLALRAYHAGQTEGGEGKGPPEPGNRSMAQGVSSKLVSKDGLTQQVLKYNFYQMDFTCYLEN